MSSEDDDEARVFECPICMKLLLDPVSTGCGHTFCRACITRSLDYRQQCPSCRAPCSSTLGVNVLLSSLIRQRFREQLSLRERERQEEIASAGQPDVAPSDGIYPTIILKSKITILPGLVVSVPTLEASEQAAVQFAVSTGSMRLCVFHSSKISRGGVGLICQLLHAGTSQAAVKCLYRCALVEFPPILHEEFHYACCRVSLVNDEDYTEQILPQLSDLALEISTLLERQLDLVGAAGRAVFVEAFGQPPLPNRPRTAAQWEEFSFWLCTCLDTRGVWQLVLQNRSTIERLRMLRELLRRAGSESVLSISSGRSWLRLRSALAGIIGLLLIVLALWLKGSGHFDRIVNRRHDPY
jgi:Zinc finger, C3HC4 type (RING finger)